MNTPHDSSEPERSSGPSPRAALRSIERHMAEQQPVKDPVAHQAQLLVYEAMEATSGDEERRLIKRALELDEMNVDALLHALAYTGVDGEAEIDALRKIVAIGEKRLGPQMFAEHAGGFWELVETRPYMRARERLAEALRGAGRLDEAIVEYEAMLELNPNDNQAVRYMLVPTYLRRNRLDSARKLFTRYTEAEYNPVFAWGEVLERFLVGDLPSAVTALAAARKQNRYMQGYIKGHRRLPVHLPAAYVPGSKEEALCFSDVLPEAWEAHPEALQWLNTQKC